MSLTLQSWREAAALIVVTTVPLQTLETALVMVESYLSANGGWNPDDTADPTGVGQPVNGETPEQAAVNIEAEEFASVYTATGTATITVEYTYTGKLTQGLDYATVISSLGPSIQNYLTAQLNDTQLVVSDVGTPDGTVSAGVTTQTDRQTIESTISTDKKDVRITALSLARDRYGLDTTWNVSQSYTESDENIAIFVVKYVDTTYATVDTTSTETYVMKHDPTTHKLVSGIKLSS